MRNERDFFHNRSQNKKEGSNLMVSIWIWHVLFEEKTLENKYFLDVTERIIAMGFPADNYESIYRNSMTDVIK